MPGLLDRSRLGSWSPESTFCSAPQNRSPQTIAWTGEETPRDIPEMTLSNRGLTTPGEIVHVLLPRKVFGLASKKQTQFLKVLCFPKDAPTHLWEPLPCRHREARRDSSEGSQPRVQGRLTASSIVPPGPTLLCRMTGGREEGWGQRKPRCSLSAWPPHSSFTFI